MEKKGFDNRIINKIFEIACEEDLNSKLTGHNDELMKAFLQFGSETDDNINCVAHIEYGLVTDHANNTYGLKVKGKSLLLSEIMNSMEDFEIPNKLKELFPELNNGEWGAIMRMITMMLLAIERKKTN